MKKLFKTIISIFLTIGICSNTIPIYASEPINMEYVHGSMSATIDPKWKTLFTNEDGTRLQSLYVDITLGNQHVYCVQPSQLVQIGNTDYTSKSMESVFGTTKTKDAQYAYALGYALNKSDEMDYATQIVIWQALYPGLSDFDYASETEKRVNDLWNRIKIMKTNVKFETKDIVLYDYGIENGVTLTDSSGVFTNYIAHSTKGIHTKKEGNKLTIWAEPGDKLDTTITYDCFYSSNLTSPSVLYVSPTSQNVVHMGIVAPNTTSLHVSLDLGSAQISKTDITQQEEIEGAELCVVDENGNIVDSWVSDSTSHLVKNLVKDKSYTLIENLAPIGYAKANHIPFTIEDTSTPVLLNISNKMVQVEKIDQNQNRVENATLQVIDQEGNVVDEWITYQQIVSLTEEQTTSLFNKEIVHLENGVCIPNENSITCILNGNEYIDIDETGKETCHRVKNLVVDETYTLQEVKVPADYIASDPITFTVSPDQNDWLSMVDIKTTTVEFSKVDASTKEEIEGANLKVIDENENIIDEWTSTKKVHKVKGLIIGNTYTLVEETAPNGYQKAESITFVAKENMDKIVMEDEEFVRVPTGTHTNVMIYCICMISLSIVFAILTIKLRKNRK